MATAPITEPSQACPTTIATLHTAYARAYEAFNINEEEAFSSDLTPGETLRRTRAMGELISQADALSLAVLRETPTSAADATLVAWHTSLAVSDVDDTHIHVALQNVTAFLSGLVQTPLPGGEWFAQQFSCLTGDVAARSAA